MKSILAYGVLFFLCNCAILTSGQFVNETCLTSCTTLNVTYCYTTSCNSNATCYFICDQATTIVQTTTVVTTTTTTFTSIATTTTTTATTTTSTTTQTTTTTTPTTTTTTQTTTSTKVTTIALTTTTTTLTSIASTTTTTPTTTTTITTPTTTTTTVTSIASTTTTTQTTPSTTTTAFTAITLTTTTTQTGIAVSSPTISIITQTTTTTTQTSGITTPSTTTTAFTGITLTTTTTQTTTTTIQTGSPASVVTITTPIQVSTTTTLTSTTTSAQLSITGSSISSATNTNPDTGATVSSSSTSATIITTLFKQTDSSNPISPFTTNQCACNDWTWDKCQMSQTDLNNGSNVDINTVIDCYGASPYFDADYYANLIKENSKISIEQIQNQTQAALDKLQVEYAVKDKVGFSVNVVAISFLSGMYVLIFLSDFAKLLGGSALTSAFSLGSSCINAKPGRLSPSNCLAKHKSKKKTSLFENSRSPNDIHVQMVNYNAYFYEFESKLYLSMAQRKILTKSNPQLNS